MKKLIYILSACSLIFSACSKDEEAPVEPEKFTSHYYYSYELGETISGKDLNLAEADFTPGASYIRGDTLFIANTTENKWSLELYDRKNKKHLASLNSWTYKGNTQSFGNRIEAIAVSGNRLYLANIGSCIDVFDVNTLSFITRIGTRVWGEGKNQMLHSHAMVISGGYILIRMKNRMQVYFESDVTEENYQKIPFYARGSATGFDTNNGFYSHQMVADKEGRILLADYGQYGNKKIQVLDTALIQKGNNIDMVNTGETMALDFNPTGIAVYKEMIFISDAAGYVRVYDRTKQTFVQRFNSFKNHKLGKAQKLTVDGDRLWISDPANKQLVGMDIYRNELREY